MKSNLYRKWKNYWNLSNKQRKDLKKIVIKSSIRLWDLTTERKIGKAFGSFRLQTTDPFYNTVNSYDDLYIHLWCS